jgi:hypothetical protein
LVAQGVCLLPGPWLAPKIGKEPRIGFRLSSIESLRLGQALEPQVEVEGVLGLGPILSRKVRVSAPKGCSP